MTDRRSLLQAPGPDAAVVYDFNWPSALRAALVASAGITGVMLVVPPLLGVEAMDHGIVVGAMVLPEGGAGAYLVRAGWHVVNAWIFTLVYAAILLVRQRQSNVWKGAAFGAVLWLVGPMTVLPALLYLHPAVRAGVLKSPGVFMLPLGWGLLPAGVDLFAHLVHGALSGLVYRHRVHAIEAPSLSDERAPEDASLALTN
jgi:hypothetical protein